MNSESPIIEIKNLSRRYGKLDAVHGLNHKATKQPRRPFHNRVAADVSRRHYPG